MATHDQAQQAIIEAITQMAPRVPNQPAIAGAVLRLAESWAWLESPDQPHGSAPSDDG